MVIFFDNRDKEILTIVTPNDTQFDIESFLDTRFEYDENFKYIKREDVGYAIIDKADYDKSTSYENSIIRSRVDMNTNEFVFDIQKREAVPNRNRSYSDCEYKREYSLEEVRRMYEEDYLNINLKNVLKTGVVQAKFIPISELNIRPTITQKTWRHFVNDPFLRDAHSDKLSLAKSIIKDGTWWPFVVAPMDDESDDLYVFEGNHRIVSLKLLAMNGEISEDFKVFCLILPFNFKEYKKVCKYIPLPYSVKYRYIIEDMYGCDILADNELLKKALETIKNNGEILINEYTVEAETTMMNDIFGVVHAYPIFLRDLIYLHDKKVTPSQIINNEEAFLKWIKE